MDDETAEIELLEQNLNKTRQVSQRMTAILSSFDSRLMKLEKSILPLYNSTQLLTRRAQNIDSALTKIDELGSGKPQEEVAVEEGLILRGPQTSRLHEYIEAMQKMNASLAFAVSFEGSARDTARLVETGAKKLIQLFTTFVAEASSRTPITGPDFLYEPFPDPLMQNLLPLVTFLRTLPVPATHPSHPAAPGIYSALKEAMKGYGEMRGSWMLKNFETYGKRILDRAETIDGIEGGHELGSLTENILNVSEEEYTLLTTLAPLPGQATIQSTYITLTTPIVKLFSNTVTSLNAIIKRHLHRHAVLVLSTYANLNKHQSRWDDVITRRGVRKENELKDAVNAVRAMCQRGFAEFIADIKAAALTPRWDGVTTIIDTTAQTVEYLERLPELRKEAASVLLILGDGNWKMGEGTQVGKTRGDVDEQTILEHFTYDVVSTTVQTLLALSRSNKRPAFGSVFLLNNMSYLRSHLLLEPRSDVPTLFSRPTREILESNFRIAKAGYFDTSFMPVLQALDDRDKSRSAVKEKLARFYDSLEEVAERHKIAKVLDGDEEGRETICDEVIKLVVPSLQRFLQRNKDFSRNPQKHIKKSPDEIESLIKTFYYL